jgi:hypothetical protein
MKASDIGATQLSRRLRTGSGSPFPSPCSFLAELMLSLGDL